MSKIVHLLLVSLASLAHCGPLPSSFSSLPPGCSNYTVGACSPQENELVGSYPGLPSPALCQEVCNIQEDCFYFSHTASTGLCQLYHYRFLASCHVLGGPPLPTIDACQVVDSPSCDSFMRETCSYTGQTVLNTTAITNAHACQAQ